MKAYHDLSSLVFADKPLGDRTSDVVAYVKESLQPALDKVVEILQATKETVEDKAQEEGVDVGAVKGKAEGVKGKAEGKAKEVCYFFSLLLFLSFFSFVFSFRLSVLRLTRSCFRLSRWVGKASRPGHCREDEAEDQGDRLRGAFPFLCLSSKQMAEEESLSHIWQVRQQAQQ